MAIMNDIKEGADLGHPKPSVGWTIGGVVSVIMLLFVIGMGSMLYGKVSGFTGKAQTTAGSIVDKVTAYGSGYN